VIFHRPVDALHFHDNRLGRALDALWESGLDRSYGAVISRAIHCYALDLARLHTDATSLKLDGAYERDEGAVMRNYAVRLLHHAARRHGAIQLPPLLKGLALRVRGLALFRQHRIAPAGHTSNLSTDVARVMRPGSWEHDGLPSGGLRWSTGIASAMTGDHTAGPDG
jgi:hypothetical protein